MDQQTPLATQSVDENLSICPQLHVEDMRRAAAAGFRSIINNRPDFESSAPQPTSVELQAAAREAGLEYRHLPVPPSNQSEADARKMNALMGELPRPVLAFCRTGKRAESLYRMGQSLQSQDS